MGLFDERTGGLVTYWKSVSAITSLVGSGTSARIWPDAAKEGQPSPYLVYVRVPGGDVFRHLRGTTGARRSILNIYAWGDTRSVADSLIEVVKIWTQNDRMRGTWEGTYVNWVFVLDAGDAGYDKPIDGSDNKKFWSRLALAIVHGESGGT